MGRSRATVIFVLGFAGLEIEKKKKKGWGKLTVAHMPNA